MAIYPGDDLSISPPNASMTYHIQQISEKKKTEGKSRESPTGLSTRRSAATNWSNTLLYFLRIKMTQVVTDKNPATVKPVNDDLSIVDYVSLIRKAKSDVQIKAIKTMIDEIHLDDESFMQDSDWELLNQTIISCKK
jgi:hypothetical protein